MTSSGRRERRNYYGINIGRGRYLFGTKRIARGRHRLDAIDSRWNCFIKSKNVFVSPWKGWNGTGKAGCWDFSGYRCAERAASPFLSIPFSLRNAACLWNRSAKGSLDCEYFFCEVATGPFRSIRALPELDRVVYNEYSLSFLFFLLGKRRFVHGSFKTRIMKV